MILTENAKSFTVDQENLKPAYDSSYIVEVREAEPELTHDEITIEGKPATCTEAGLSDGSYCADCGAIVKEQTLIGNRLYTQEEFELGTKFVADNWRELGLDRMVTDRLPLSEIEKALHMMLNGENICKIVINCQQ